jgi:flagellar biosynthesis anti-sigma factor FlgM
MTNTINTQNRPPTAGGSTDTKTASTTAQNTGGGKSNASSSGSSTIVKLSSSTLIQELSDQIKDLPEVNEARVESIKQALVNGEYVPDAEVIARKYSEIEQLLP